MSEFKVFPCISISNLSSAALRVESQFEFKRALVRFLNRTFGADRLRLWSSGLRGHSPAPPALNANDSLSDGEVLEYVRALLGGVELTDFTADDFLQTPNQRPLPGGGCCYAPEVWSHTRSIPLFFGPLDAHNPRPLTIQPAVEDYLTLPDVSLSRQTFAELSAMQLSLSVHWKGTRSLVDAPDPASRAGQAVVPDAK